MITSVGIRNFKCLRDVTVPLSPLTVLIGQNDTGKSSVLQALHVLSQTTSAVHLQDVFMGERQFGELVRRRDQSQTIGWKLEVAPDARNGLPAPLSYSLELRSAGAGVEVESERGLCPPSARDTFTADRSRNGQAPADDDQAVIEDPARKPAGQPALRFFLPRDRTLLSRRMDLAARECPTLHAAAAALATTPILRLDPQALSRPARLTVGRPGLAADGTGLPVVIDHLFATTDRARLALFERDLRAVAPSLAHVSAPPAEVETSKGTEVGKGLEYELISGERLPARAVSQGVLLVTAFLALAHGPASSGVVLIEEPENAIHPRQLQRIVGHLRQLTLGDHPGGPVQIVMTTHSPYLLDFVKPEEVVAFARKTSGEGVCQRLSAIEGVKTRLDHGSTLGEVWFNVGERELLKDLLSVKMLLFSEGALDVGEQLSEWDAEPCSGAARILTLRVVGEHFGREVRDHEVEVKLLRSLPRLHAFDGHGYPNKVLRAVQEACDSGFGCAAIVIDRDGSETRRGDLDEGRERALGDRDPKVQLVAQHTAIGVAVETVEAWLLADEQALSAALGSMVSRQADPEDFTGGPGSARHPKRVLRALIPSGHEYGATYDAIAEQARLDVVSDRCPRGFGPYAAELRARAR